MTNYTRGRAREYQCMQVLEKEGYLALRMAGSHSPFDVIGLLLADNTELPIIRAIQCKLGSSPTKEAYKQLKGLKIPAVIQKEIWHFQNRKPTTIQVVKNG